MTQVINAGIGEIRYTQPGNIQLQQIMERLTEMIEKVGPKKTLDILNGKQ